MNELRDNSNFHVHPDVIKRVIDETYMMKKKDKCKYVNGTLEGCAPLQCRLLNRTPWTLANDLGFNYIRVEHLCQSDVFKYCPFCGFLL